MAAPDSRAARDPAIVADMISRGIDADLSYSILDDWNSGMYRDSAAAIRAEGVPEVDDGRVIALGAARAGRALVLRIDRDQAAMNLARFGLALPPESAAAAVESGTGRFTEDSLRAIGERLLPRTAYGVLNGGSATSYADGKKNLAFGQEVADALRPAFETLSPQCRDRPKGLTPAYLNPDGSPGASFLTLKMRARLVAALRLRGATDAGGDFMPLFQMSSTGNDAELAQAYRDAAKDPLLATLAEKVGLGPADWHTGVQPMIAAYTHSSEGEPRRVFDRAYGTPGATLPLPGGHGQSFRILAPVLRHLRKRGARYACLGNVDNIAYLPDPLEIGIMAVTGAPAGFDFSLRTPMDVKGGILVNSGGRMTIADIGPAISFDEVRALEGRGQSILFNCASGIFDLDWLVPNLDRIGRALPVRMTDQDKDAGRYAQAEQVTWEVAGITDGFLAFAVDKYERFIAAKLLAETLLTSGVAHGDPRLPEGLARTADALHAGLERTLVDICDLRLRDGRWIPAESD